MLAHSASCGCKYSHRVDVRHEARCWGRVGWRLGWLGGSGGWPERLNPSSTPYLVDPVVVSHVALRAQPYEVGWAVVRPVVV